MSEVNIMQTIDEAIVSLKEEMAKFEGGNKAAGTRARKILQDIKNAAQQFRGIIQEAQKADKSDK
jgi:prefoldin subunit 5